MKDDSRESLSGEILTDRRVLQDKVQLFPGRLRLRRRRSSCWRPPKRHGRR